jgi:hypothetical protein
MIVPRFRQWADEVGGQLGGQATPLMNTQWFWPTFRDSSNVSRPGRRTSLQPGDLLKRHVAQVLMAQAFGGR